MDKTILKVVCFKKTTKFIYKKLSPVGYTDENHKSEYFESISESDFNSLADKHLLRIESLTLQRHSKF